MGKIKNKWDSLDKGIQKWATRVGAIVTIVGAITAAGSWLAGQIDDSLATKFENQTSELQQEVQKLSDKVDDQDKETELQLTRLELMMLMDNDPYNTVEVERIAHHYFKDLGGNSYMSSLYAKYCKQYGTDCEIMYR